MSDLPDPPAGMSAHEQRRQAAMSEHKEYTRLVEADHLTGSPSLERTLYRPNGNGRCRCVYCRDARRVRLNARRVDPS